MPFIAAHRLTLVFSLILAATVMAAAEESNWPQFRGPGGLGVGTGKPPVEFGPGKNERWKVEVPHGHSSPCIWGGKIFLTGLDAGKLVTFCLDRLTGHELWRAVAPADKIEPTHRIGSPASSTPCTDGERLYVYFGSFGVLAYDLNGKEAWRKPLPVPVVEARSSDRPRLTSLKLWLRSAASCSGMCCRGILVRSAGLSGLAMLLHHPFQFALVLFQ